MRKSFSDISPNIKTCLHIFDHTLKPILLYGSEIWGAHTLPNYNKEFKLETTMAKFPYEKLNIKFSKFILTLQLLENWEDIPFILLLLIQY